MGVRNAMLSSGTHLRCTTTSGSDAKEATRYGWNESKQPMLTWGTIVEAALAGSRLELDGTPTRRLQTQGEDAAALGTTAADEF
eukprot:CAMPEP_0170184380 /NCGR_PEP_ID=MMETSP0040_2-20121228/33485_1 /TAXON_ID=641309 /ORGANISM="Lotharella oceanica, Strain CCMP622" /LENGTH=83 /DNA_ID=CAMNT_0010430433 /DNA_START=575 /DNA_END=827 /DNA_ORIENTATION=+